MGVFSCCNVMAIAAEISAVEPLRLAYVIRIGSFILLSSFYVTMLYRPCLLGANWNNRRAVRVN